MKKENKLDTEILLELIRMMVDLTVDIEEEYGE